jgi:D-serine deaminase-like pyridoxal phosphate-dependent protein
MAGIEVCAIDDIAISVLTSVIGSQPERGRILIDAGWMALSRDRGTAGPAHAVDQGYGLVCDAQGRPIDGLIVTATTQEHGIVALRPGASARLPELPVGTLLRILPNHACATAAQHAAYHLIPAAPGADGAPLPLLPRFGGW